jgi:hypothetical protein
LTNAHALERADYVLMFRSKLLIATHRPKKMGTQQNKPQYGLSGKDYFNAEPWYDPQAEAQG